MQRLVQSTGIEERVSAGPLSVGLELEGPLDVEALLGAFQELPGRYPQSSGSRSAAGAEDLPGRHPAVPHNDLTGLGSAQRQELALQYRASETGAPSVFVAGPFLAVLCRPAADVHELTLSAPALMYGPRALGAVARDLGQLYTWSLLGESPDSGASIEAAAFRPPMQVPGGPDPPQPRSPIAMARFPHDKLGVGLSRRTLSCFSLAIRQDLTSDVKRISVETGVGEYPVCCAAFAILLSRFSGQPDVVVGVSPAELVASCRQQLIGSGNELRPLAVHVDPSLSGVALIHAVRAGIDTALDEWGVVSAPAAESLQPPVSFRFGPLLTADCVEFFGLTASLRRVRVKGGDHEAALCLNQRVGGLQLEWQYDERLFDAGAIEHWADSYRSILHGLLEEGNSPVALLEATTDRQMSLLSGWNAKQAYGADGADRPLVHESFEALARQWPHRVALRAHGAGAVSREEIESASNRLARELRAWGACASARVGVLLESGVDLVVAHLAMLKTGAACLPLDPRLSGAGLGQLMAFANLDFLVSHSGLSHLLGEAVVRVLFLDEAAAQIAALPAAAMDHDELSPAAGTTAYVIFSPGSAAEPLGAILSHRALAAGMAAMSLQPGTQEGDRLAALLGQDGSHSPLLPIFALCRGAEILVGGPDVMGNGDALRLLLESSEATTMRVNADAWQALVDAGWLPPAGFKVLMPATELTGRLAAQLLDRKVDLWCFHEVLEAAGWVASTRVVESDLLSYRGSDPDRRLIGRPTANATVWILDQHGAACPIGVPGEIHIGGDVLADGYLNRVLDTAEFFVPDLVGGCDGRKLFRTGERGRWRHDGVLEYFGHADSQEGRVGDELATVSEGVVVQVEPPMHAVPLRLEEVHSGIELGNREMADRRNADAASPRRHSVAAFVIVVLGLVALGLTYLQSRPPAQRPDMGRSEGAAAAGTLAAEPKPLRPAAATSPEVEPTKAPAEALVPDGTIQPEPQTQPGSDMGGETPLPPASSEEPEEVTCDKALQVLGLCKGAAS